MKNKTKKNLKTKNPKVQDLIALLKAKAPFDWAEAWDNVGFLAGNATDDITGIVSAVNLGPEALAEAKRTKSNVIVCHHPPIFKPILKLTHSSHPYLFEAIKRGISVIAMHTNFDLASSELSKSLCQKLGCTYKDVLIKKNQEFPASLRLGKFITYLPEKHLEPFREALWKAGAGQTGEYSHTSFSSVGEGTFFGNPATTQPFVGKSGRLEKVIERRVELIFPWDKLNQILKAAQKAHPYEEMAYDLVPLAQPKQEIGYGFIAEVSHDLDFQKLLNNVKQVFQLRTIMIAGPGLLNPKLKIKRLAFSPGSGSSFIGAAAAQGIDAYFCGEVGYHKILEAKQKNLTLGILGHSYSERFFVETIAAWSALLITGRKIFKVFETIHEVY